MHYKENDQYTIEYSNKPKLSVITALSTETVVSTEITKGTVDGDKFIEFVQGNLIPEMMPFDGQNSKSVAILDNFNSSCFRN